MTRKVSISRRWTEPVPIGSDGKPISKRLWPRRRKHVWVVRWFTADGKRPQLTAATKEDAEKIAAKKTEEFGKSLTARNVPGKVTLEELKKEILKLKISPKGKRLSPATVEEYRMAMAKLVGFFGDDVRLTAICPADAARFVSVLRKTACKNAPERTLTDSTVGKTLSAVKAAFNTAVHQLKYLPSNPFEGVSRDASAEKAVRYVTAKEFKSLLAAVNKLYRKKAPRLWWRTFLTVCYTTGTRLNEALHLIWPDVDFEADEIRIVAKTGEGLLDWQTKSKKGRTIPVPPFTMNLLAKMQTTLAEADSPYIFIAADRLAAIRHAKAARAPKGKDLPPINNIRKKWLEIRRRAKLQPATIHDLRRSCITNWARRLSIHVTRRLAGHADITTTTRYYVAVLSDDMDAARKATAEAIAAI